MDENLFALFHAYNKLVRRGLVQPLRCACGGTYITGLRENSLTEDDLVLNCFDCNSTTTPGETTIQNVKAVVSEHFMEE